MINQDKKKLLNLLEVLGDKNRLGIVLSLAGGERCVCEIFKFLKLSQNLASHHLGILRKKKVIINRRQGKWVYYSLNKKWIEELLKFFEDIKCCCEKQIKN